MYSDILDEAIDNIVNHGGTNATIYYAPAADILTDSVIGTVTNPEDEYILTTGPVMKTGKKAYAMDIVVTSGGLNAENIGEDEGHAFKIAPVFRIKGNNPKGLILMNSTNGRFVFWLPLNNGKTVQVGSKKLPAYIKPAYKAGETKGPGSFFDFTPEAYNGRFNFFEGTIPLTPAA